LLKSRYRKGGVGWKRSRDGSRNQVVGRNSWGKVGRKGVFCPRTELQ